MWQFNYQKHADFIESARERGEIWRICVGFVLIACGSLLLPVAIYPVLNKLFFSIFQDYGVAYVLAVLLSFSSAALCVFLVLERLHKRKWTTVFGIQGFDLTVFAKVSGALALLMVGLMILSPWDFEDPLVQNRPFFPWLASLPFFLVAIFIQTSAEEILCRGYLQQNLAARFRSPLIWMLIPSVLFGLLHYDPVAAGENVWLLVIWAGFFGAMMADITARSGSLAPAIAVHFTNNVFAIFIIALPDDLGAGALYHLPFDLSDSEMVRAWMPVDFANIVVMWLLVRLIIRR